MAETFISRENLSGLIPEPVTQEIIQGTVQSSAVLQMGRKLPNMTSKTVRMNVLDMLPTAYFVDGDTGMKKTTRMQWDKKTITAEEIAVIVPIPEAALDDANYDIWGEVRPRIVEAFGKVIDGAVLFGVNKPTSWRGGLVPSATTAGAIVAQTGDTYQDILGVGGVVAKVEESGFLPTGAMGAVKMRAVLRGLVDNNGQPIFKATVQGSTEYAVDGTPITFPMNGAFDATEALMIVGDFNQLVYSIRQDMTYKLLTEATIVDPSTNEIVYNLAQQDMVALRAVMRLGWEIPNPINAFNTTSGRFPFAVYVPDTANPSITTRPSSTSVAVNATKKITATTVPANAAVTWTSSDSTKATVSNGTVTGVSAGTATITASITVDGATYTDQTVVTVTGS